jgi:hypothetical protein
MRPGFIKMGQKVLFKLLVGGFFRHLRQRLHELFLGVIDVLQLMYEQVVHRLDVFAEESHCVVLCLGNMQAQAFFRPDARASCSMLVGANRVAKRMFLKASKTP